MINQPLGLKVLASSGLWPDLNLQGFQNNMDSRDTEGGLEWKKNM
jgi:hypothetical protein